MTRPQARSWRAIRSMRPPGRLERREQRHLDLRLGAGISTSLDVVGRLARTQSSVTAMSSATSAPAVPAPMPNRPVSEKGQWKASIE